MLYPFVKHKQLKVSVFSQNIDIKNVSLFYFYKKQAYSEKKCVYLH